MVVIEAGRRKGGQLIESRGERGGWRMGRGGKDCKKSEIMKKRRNIDKGKIKYRIINKKMEEVRLVIFPFPLNTAVTGAKLQMNRYCLINPPVLTCPHGTTTASP